MNKQKKQRLRYLSENSEGVCYESNMSLFTEVCMPIANFTDGLEPLVVYFDLETSGFSMKSEILQIGAIHENSKFFIYITPTKQIHEEATDVHRPTAQNK